MKPTNHYIILANYYFIVIIAHFVLRNKRFEFSNVKLFFFLHVVVVVVACECCRCAEEEECPSPLKIAAKKC